MINRFFGFENSRRMRRGDGQQWPTKPKHFKEKLSKAFDFLENLVYISLSTLTESYGGNLQDLLTECGEHSPLPFSSSPFDLFYYHNELKGIGVPNCNQHKDPVHSKTMWNL